MSGGTGAAGCHFPVPGRGPGNTTAGPLRSAATAIPPSHWEDSLAFGALPGAVPCARGHTKLVLMEWGLHHVVEPALYIVSELMTNSVKVSQPLPQRPPVVLTLHASSHQLMIGVWDAVSQPPAPKQHDIDAEGGRGLDIVTMLSDQWGYHHPAYGGKTTWASLTTHRAPNQPGNHSL
jgi:histidine kinase-like protein